MASEKLLLVHSFVLNVITATYTGYEMSKLYSLKPLKTEGYLCNYTVQIPSGSSFLVNRVEYNLFPILQ